MHRVANKEKERVITEGFGLTELSFTDASPGAGGWAKA